MRRAGFYIDYEKNLNGKVKLFYGYIGGQYSCEVSRRNALSFAVFLEKAAKMIRKQKGAGRG